MRPLIIKKGLFWTVCGLFLLNIFVIGNTQSSIDGYKGILEVDAVGYYSYLPAIFVYKDLNLSFIEKNSNHYISDASSLVCINTNHGNVNRYFIGTAILMAPFYLTGTLITEISAIPNDGYSKYQILSISIAATFYLYAALYLIGILLKEQFHLSQKTIILTIISFALGTNLFYYSIFEPGMSHIYSFFSISILLYFFNRYVVSKNNRYLFLSFISIGLITVIRPLNFLIVLSLLVIWPNDSIKIIKDFFTSKISIFISGLCIFFSIIFLQLLYYKFATDHWYVDSYNDVGFNFLSPQSINILFSYRKGLFIYMPILFISLIGLYYWSVKQPLVYLRWFILFTLITYILSSWFSWSYGGCFGNRAFIEYYILFIIPFAYLIEHLLNKIPKTVYAGIVCIILFCQIQTYQYRYYYIHWDEMNKEKYWKVFLRIDYLIKKKPVHEIY
jgi:hypothetical protein